MIPQIQSGIILRRSPYGETDEIVTALLEGAGVRRFFASGIRKSQKRFAGRMELFSHALLSCIPRREGLWRLVGAEQVGGDVGQAWTDPLHFALGNLLSEIICIFTPEEVPAADLFLLWRELTGALEKRAFTNDSVIETLLKFMSLLGYDFDKNKRDSEGWQELTDREILARLIGFCETQAQKPLKSARFFMSLVVD